jgi:release factor glutamine methyltransferase
MGLKIQTLKDIRICLSKELQGTYPDPEISALARIIIKTLPETKQLHRIYDPNQPVSSENLSHITQYINELKEGKPIQYILGSTEFYNCKIRATRATLIPRQETEELVDLIIRENKAYKGNIVDFGTGSGCIAIALSKYLSGSSVTGTDISAAAIDVARESADLNNVPVNFLKDDIFNPVEILSLKTGIIVSNPPYVRNSEKMLMHRNILDYEPDIALFVDDSDPLIFYRKILEIADTILLPEGKVYFEINEAMGSEMIDLMNRFRYSETKLIRDINNRDRIIKGKKNG